MICRLGLEDADEGKWALGEVGAFDLSVSTECRPVICTEKHTDSGIHVRRNTQIQHLIIDTDTQRDAQTNIHTRLSTNTGGVFLSQHLLSSDVLIPKLNCCTPSGH